jgi:hypothetical protein
MAEITLGDYAGYIFTEMVKAREAADAYSRALAVRYRDDEVLQHFSVPRFKTPKIDVTVPVLISGARFRQTVRFTEPENAFVSWIGQRADAVRTEVALSQGGFPRSGPARLVDAVPTPGVEKAAHAFYSRLVDNADPSAPGAIVAESWREVFRAVLAGARLLTYWLEHDERADLLTRSTNEVLEHVRSRTVVSATAIESLLVNPETNVVKGGSDENSVFVVSAELLEEGFYLHSVKDEDTGVVTQVVEFD